jgi:[acyl-carrier-protein] S-malonyltransferase
MLSPVPRIRQGVCDTVTEMLAFVFPGQGSQRVGMGADLLQASPELYERHLAQADEVSGLPIRRYSLEGPPESLTETQVAQPALFALSLAVAEAARAAGLAPDFVAGHSLGEYTAAVVSGALAPADGMRLVCERGRLMAAIQSERPGAMAAVIGLAAERLAELCGEASEAGVVALANLNTPAQTVVSGEEAAVERLMELAREAGAAKVVRLQVGAAFHSELMKPVQTKLGALMDELEWRDPGTPLVGNASARILTTGREIHEALVAQIASPVRWVECVQRLVDAGCSTFLELGSGRVLGGLIRQIVPGAETFAAESPAQLAAVAAGPRIDTTAAT